MLRRIAVLGLVGGVILAIAGPASAKGVESATIEGPGLAEPVSIDYETLGVNDDTLQRFLDSTGFWYLFYAPDPAWGLPGELITGPPMGDLGPEYVVTWYLGGEAYPAPSYLYPLAPGGPLVHVEEGAPGGFHGTPAKLPGGWFAAEPELLDMLEVYGVAVGESEVKAKPAAPEPPAVEVAAPPPMTPDPTPRTDSVPVVGISLIVAAVLAAGTWVWAARRRPRRLGAS
jgi:hypothetical protein